MTVGLVVASAGVWLLSLIGPDTSYLTGVLPAVVVFGLGLSAAVAPLTTAVLDAAEDRHAGVASGVNNAVARAAGDGDSYCGVCGSRPVPARGDDTSG